MLLDYFNQLLFVGVLMSGILLIAARVSCDAWLNPLVLYAPYIGLGSCFIAACWLEYSNLALVSSFGLLFYLTGLFFAYGIFYKRSIGNASSGVVNPKTFQRIGWGAAIVVATLLIVSIPSFRSAGYNLDEVGNFRFAVRQDNKIIFVLYFALKYFVLYSIIIASSRRLLFFSASVYLVGLVPLVLLGSKGTLLFIFFDAAFVFYMRGQFTSINGGIFSLRKSAKITYTRLLIFGLFILAMMLVAPLTLSLLGTAPDYHTAMVALYGRLLSGFDAALYSFTAGLSPGQAGASSITWWFASHLKALHLYTNPFNAVNQYIMYYYIGAEMANAGGMFPNNFQVMEFVLPFHPLMSIPLLGASGFIYGGAIAWLCRRRLKSPLHCLWFILLTNNPYTMLIDGQSFWANSAIWALASLPIGLMQIMSAKKSAIKIRRPVTR